MRFSRRVLLIGRLCCAWGLWIGATLAAEEVRVAVSDGHVAVQTAAGASWTLLAAGDVVPDAADFRTSAAGAVTIPAAGDVITIGPESWGRWDHSQRSLAIERGRVLIAVGSNNAWSITARGVRFAAPQSSTISVAADGDHIACDVLRGEVQISGDALESGHFSAPAAIAIRAGKTEVSVPNDRNWATAAVAWAQPQPRQGPGQLLAREPDSNVTRRLKIARYHVNVVLQPPVALVQIDQSFYNPQDWGQAEGTFVFNLPHQASVSRFAMFVTHEDLIEGELIERSRADQVYTSIVHRRRDPAILEQIGDNLFRMRVFPIPARDTKRILLDYTVPLQAENGQYRFVLPLMSDLEPIWELKLTGTIHPPLDMATVASPSHADLKFTPAEDGTVHFEQRQEQVQPPPAFLLGYRGPTDPAPHVRSFTATSPGSSLRLMHFVATIPAWESTHATADQRPLDVQIVADTSSSAGDMRLMRQAVRTVVAGLRETDRFQLGCADASYRPLTQEWLAPRSAEAAQAFSALDAQLPLGSSQIWESLQTVFRSPPGRREGRQRLVVYVGDGISTDNPPLGEWSAPMLDNQTQFAAIRIGRTAEKAVFLQRLVELTGGMLFPVGEAPSELGQVFGWLLAGAPAPQRVESVAVSSAAEAAARDVHFPAVWPHGRPLEITGRTLGAEQLKLRVKLAKEDTAREYELQVPKHEKDEDVFVGRYWTSSDDRMLQESPQRLWQRSESRRVMAARPGMEPDVPLTAFLVLEKGIRTMRNGTSTATSDIVTHGSQPARLTSLPLPPEMRPEQPHSSKRAGDHEAGPQKP
ncbi:MAG: VIT and VWA domain-containing protein [Planctomycetaceae bacterium]